MPAALRLSLIVLRDLIAAVLTLLAVLLAAAAVPALWMEKNLVQEKGFLAITQPLGEDPSFQRSLTDPAVEQAFSAVEIPNFVRDLVEPQAKNLASDLTGTDVYATVWNGTMKQLHGALFTPGAAPLQVDLEPLIERVLSGAEKIVPVEIPRPQHTEITLATVPDVPVLAQMVSYAQWAHRLVPLAILSAVLAVLCARHRRSMIAVGGVLMIVAGVVVTRLAESVEQLVPDAVDQAPFVGQIVRVFEARFTADVVPQGGQMVTFGVLVMILGLLVVGVSLLLRHRRTLRTQRASALPPS